MKCFCHIRDDKIRLVNGHQNRLS